MREIANTLFWLLWLAGIVCGILALNFAGLLPYGIAALMLSMAASIAEEDHRLGLRKVIVALAALTALCTLHFSLGIAGWIVFAVLFYIALTVNLGRDYND